MQYWLEDTKQTHDIHLYVCMCEKERERDTFGIIYLKMFLLYKEENHLFNSVIDNLPSLQALL